MTIPIACKLTDAELRARREGLLARARSSVVAASWKDDGLTLEFEGTPAMLAIVLEVVQVERQCCPFLRFQVDAGPDGRPISLAITGPAGTRAFLETLGLASVVEG
jgi:hypothetical protein